LPEVQTVVGDIRPIVEGLTIDNLVYVSGVDLTDVAEHVNGKLIIKASRWGKFIIFTLSDNSVLVSHLRMTGSWQYIPDSMGASNPGFRWALSFKTKEGKRAGFLSFTDTRKFGTLDWAPAIAGYKSFQKLGPDGLILNRPEVIEEIVHRASRSSRPIKNFLMDQRNIAGVGNIYASEILFYAGVHPQTPTNQVDLSTLCKTVYYVLCKAVYFRGTSLSDYVDGYGRKGSFQKHLQVYDREDEPCFDCGASVERIIQSGRSSFYCPNCQLR